MMRDLSKIGRYTIFYIIRTIFNTIGLYLAHLSLFRASEGVSPYASR